MKPFEHVQESGKIKKCREKLIKQLQKIDQRVTQEALKVKAQQIHDWISRHAQRRVILKDKNISLFDENQHAAKLSKYVVETLDKIKASATSDCKPLIKKVDNPSSN